MKKIRDIKKSGFHLLVLLTICFQWQSALAEVTVVLRNGRHVIGTLLQEESDYVVLSMELGELKIRRSDIERISDTPFAHLAQTNSDTTQLNDQVIVYLTGGRVVDGFLMAKSRTMIMIRSEVGRLTIPKKEVERIEYILTPFSEQGEPVLAELTSGKRIEGYLQSEDRASLTVLTELGKLTIDKQDLQSLQYNISPRFKKIYDRTQKQEYAFKPTFEQDVKQVEEQQDILGFGYSSRFGDNYDNGVAFFYARRFHLSKYPSFSLNALVGVEVPYFGIDKKAYSQTTTPGGITVAGYAILPSLYLGAPIILYPQMDSSYRFVATPRIDFYLINTSLRVSYPSFPHLDKDTSKAKFRFGVGANLSIEWDVSKSLTIGIGFNPNILFSEEDHGMWFISIGTLPLYLK